MTTIRDYLNKAKFVRDNIIKETERIVYDNEKKIVNLNKNQFTDGYGSNDKGLFTVLRQYKGFYSTGYKKHGLYDFYETGVFVRGLFVNFNESKLTITIDSSGKGNGEKALFINSYTNLFGLDSINTVVLNDKIIMPELNLFISKYL
jgi:hypothetical protein